MKNLLLVLFALFVMSVTTQSANAETSEISGFAVQVNSTGGTPVANYTNVKAAFDAINLGTHTGSITVLIFSQTTEFATAVLNASGNGFANYTVVNILPGAVAGAITGNLATPLVDFNGCKFVNVDGRIGGTGTTRTLTISNSSIDPASSTIRFVNDCDSIVVNYCNVEGSSTTTGGGTILFGTTTGALGNRYLAVTNCDIRAAGANIPYCAIYSAGLSAAVPNNNIGIANNQIRDFFNPGGLCAGMLLNTGSNLFTIQGNSFYQTAVRTSTAAATVIQMYILDGITHTVTGNFIGGSAPNAGGTPYTINGAFSNYFIGIYNGSSAANPINIDGNTITNIDFSTTPSGSVLVWNGIRVAAGNANIGVTTGNIIGSQTGTGAILVTANGTLSPFVEGIITGGAGNLDIRNNKIGSISLGGPVTASSNLRAIECSGNTSLNVINNTIGGTTAGSIQTNTATGGMLGMFLLPAVNNTTYTVTGDTIRNITNNATTTTASIVGLQYQINLGTINLTANISNNVINNLVSTFTTATTGSVSGIISTTGFTTSTVDANINGNKVTNLTSNSAGASTLVRGIVNANPFNNFLNINNNIINTFSTASTNVVTTTSGAVVGIAQGNTVTATVGTCSISGNTINNLLCTGAAGTHVMGISCSHGSNTNIATISKNKIYDLRSPNATSTGLVSGIVPRGLTSTGTFSIVNNMVSINPDNVQAYGIHNNLLATQINAIYNSVNIFGTSSNAVNSGCYFRNAVATGTTLINNIFTNSRSSATGKEYTIINTNPTTPGTGWTGSNYNDYYIGNLPDMTPFIALWGTSDLDLATYKSTSGVDANTNSLLPVYVNQTTGDLHLTGSSIGNTGLIALTGTGITDDFDGQTRSANWPYKGGDENPAPAPVEMASFNANVNMKDVTLNWVTSHEINNRGFDIERTIAGKDGWAKISEVAGGGNTTENKSYTYTDRNLNSGKYNYRLKQVDYNGNFTYYSLNSEVIVGIPTVFALSQNYPNPFNPSTKIDFSMPVDGKVSIKLFDMSGREVAALINNELRTAGYYTMNFNGINLASGTYFYRINVTGGEKNFTQTKKMMLVK